MPDPAPRVHTFQNAARYGPKAPWVALLEWGEPGTGTYRVAQGVGRTPEKAIKAAHWSAGAFGA